MKKPEKPDESELLAFLDEELRPERQAEIRQMLGANWELRAQLARLERRVEQYVEATAQQASIATPLVDDLWQDFSGRLSRTTSVPAASTRLRAGLQSLTAKLTEWGQRNQPGAWRLTIGAVVSMLLMAAFVSLKTERTVSAHELLQRTAQAEAASLRRVGDPVVYRKIQVKRSGAGEPVMWESWNDARSVSGGQFRQRVADKDGLRFLRVRETHTPAIIAELAQILQANHLDAHQPLSAAAYAEWRKTIRSQSESVVEIALPGKVAGLKLTTAVVPPVADHQIIEASLTIRRADWHAVALHLNVQSENDIRSYELNETAYEVLPLQALTVFADHAPAPALTPSLTPAITAPASPSAAPASVPTAAPSTKALPTEAELKEAEVAALYALHQAQADLGEQIEVVREAGQGVIVRGLVERSERKQQLIQILNGIPHVTPRLLTIAEAVQQAQQKSGQSRAPENNGATGASIVAPNEAPAPTSAETASANAFRQRLAESAGGRGPLSEAERLEVNRKVSQLYNAIEADASAALAQAWALRRLSDRFANQTNTEASPAARQRIDEMIGNHAARLKNRTRNLRARLEPILITLAGVSPAVSPAPEGTRQARITAVFKAAEQISQLTDRLIDGSGLPVAEVEQAARQLLTEFARLEQALLALER